MSHELIEQFFAEFQRGLRSPDKILLKNLIEDITEILPENSDLKQGFSMEAILSAVALINEKKIHEIKLIIEHKTKLRI